MLKKSLIVSSMLLGLAACSSSDGEKLVKVQAMQKNDKNMTCKELLLEMNESEFYRKTAEKSEGPKLKSVLMPLGYISTYMSSQEAIDAASVRISYLDRIYQIMKCDKAEGNADSGDDGFRDIPASYQSNAPEGAPRNIPAAYEQQQGANEPQRSVLEPITQMYIPNTALEKLGMISGVKRG